MFRSRRAVPMTLRHCARRGSTQPAKGWEAMLAQAQAQQPPQPGQPQGATAREGRPESPWGDATLEALCRRDQSGEALRVVATLALGVIQRAGRSATERPPGGSEPPPPRWHGQAAAAAVAGAASADHAAAASEGASSWGPERVRRCASIIQTGLIGREREATLLLLAGLAGEHALILGPVRSRINPPLLVIYGCIFTNCL